MRPLIAFAMLLFATQAQAGREVSGIGEITPEDATIHLLDRQVLFNGEAADEISWNGAELKQFPAWMVDGFLEWDSTAEYHTSSENMGEIQDNVADILFGDARNYMWIVTSPAYLYQRMHDAGIRNLPVPILAPYINLLLAYDWTRYGTIVSRAQIPPGMSTSWKIKSWGRRYYSQGLDDVGFHMAHDTQGSWVLTAHPNDGLMFRHLPDNHKHHYTGNTTPEALRHPKINERGAAFTDFSAGHTMVIPGEAERIWKLSRMAFGELTLWRIAPQGFDAQSKTPLARPHKAYYILADTDDVVPHVTVMESRDAEGNFQHATLHVTGVGVRYDEVRDGVEIIDSRLIPHRTPPRSGKAIRPLSQTLSPDAMIMGPGFIVSDGTLVTTQTMSSDTVTPVILRDATERRTTLLHVAAGSLLSPSPTLLLDDSAENQGTSTDIRISGGPLTVVTQDDDDPFFQFDGTQQATRIDNAFDNINGGFTLGYWFKATHLPKKSKTILAIDSSSNRLRFRTELTRVQGLPLSLKATFGSKKILFEGPFDDGNWHHVALHVQGGDTPEAKFYVNGILKTVQPAGNLYGNTQGHILYLGHRAGGKNRSKFEGGMDGITFFNAPIGEAETRALFLTSPKRIDRVLMEGSTYRSATPDDQTTLPFVIGKLPIQKEAGIKLSGTTTDPRFMINTDLELVQVSPLNSEDPAEFAIQILGPTGEILKTISAEIRAENMALLKAAPWFTDAFRVWEKRLNWSKRHKVLLPDLNIRANPHIAWLKNTAHCATSGTFARKFNGYCNEFIYTILHEAGVNDLPLYRGRYTNKISCHAPFSPVRVNISVPKGRNYARWGRDVSGNPRPGDVIAIVPITGPDYSEASLGTFHTTFYSHHSKDGRYVWTLGGNQSAWTQFKKYPANPMATSFLRRSHAMDALSQGLSSAGTLHYHWNPGDTITINETGAWEVQAIDMNDANLVRNLVYPTRELQSTFYRVVPAGTDPHSPVPDGTRVHYIVAEYPQLRGPILEATQTGFQIR